MPVIIDTPKAVEESTFVLVVSFRDEDGEEITPNEAFWTLTDAQSNVINDRDEVEIAELASSISITLSGKDLALSEDRNQRRIFTVEGTYDSSFGVDLPIKEQAVFTVENLKKSPLIDEEE